MLKGGLLETLRKMTMMWWRKSLISLVKLRDKIGWTCTDTFKATRINMYSRCHK
ncbi:hypothetical protein JG687_00009685 [Phytophthora cactorum]|uniref:Uncharacterized protein n=1 Tax=Phytophthora cactorum TaxID=29920 RepID=A0A8T1UBI0_9STRA|nr:hypothetical protein JG687_00009685 [Phytophthora cactorum]